MKFIVRMLFIMSMAVIFALYTGIYSCEQVKTGVVYANNATVEKEAKADFAYQIAQITTNLLSAPITNAENFKIEFAYATAQVTANVMQIVPINQRKEFAFEMTAITTKIMNDPKLDINKAKADFSYKAAQITSKVMLTMETGSYHDQGQKPLLLRRNDEIGQKPALKQENNNAQKIPDNKSIVTSQAYTELVDELLHVGDAGSQKPKPNVKIDGEVRYHYAFNSGNDNLTRDSSGIRTYIGFDTELNKNFKANAMLEGQKSLVNYNNYFKLARLYLTGKLGNSLVSAGSFGYLMADGNIYDSRFKGARFDFGGPVKYTFSYGATDYTRETYIVSASYRDFDYSLESGLYHYQMDSDQSGQNTIWTLGGTYNFSNFGVGAMYLSSSRKDTKGDGSGYVLSLDYGALKTYRPGTYSVFAKYYDQPQGTYIAHGMNGLAGSMQGFRGYSIGSHYTIANNLVASLEYYDLKDKTTGEKGKTLWTDLTKYF